MLNIKNYNILNKFATFFGITDGYRIRLSAMIEPKKLTLLAMLAAVYSLGSFLPGFPMFGIPGSKIDVVRSLEMGYGIILGPVFGSLTAFLGALVGKILTGGGFGMFFTPLAPLSAFVAAAFSRRYILRIRGWLLASAIFIILIASWYSTNIGRAIPFYPILHFVGLGIILGFRGKVVDFIQSENKSQVSLGVALCSFPSTMAGHMLGNLIFISLIKPDPLFFMTILPVSAAERIAITFLSTIITAPLLLIMRSLFPEFLSSKINIQENSREENEEDTKIY